MSHAKKHSHGTKAERSITQTAPKASLIMLLTGLFLLSIMTAVATGCASPTALTSILAPIALFLGVAVGGFLCGAWLDGASGYACGAISAAIVAMILLAVKLFIPAPDGSHPFAVGLFLNLLIILSAMLGVLLSSRMPKRKRRRKSKHRS